MLQNPKEFFGISDDREASQKTAKHFISFVNKNSPQYIIRAMIAHIEMGLGCLVESINSTGFALSEKVIGNFGEKLNARGDKGVEQAMLSVELRKAEILIELLRR